MVRVAAVQIGPIEGDPDGTVAKAEHWLDQAGAEGVQLAVLPEGYLPGYAEIQEAKQAGSEDALAEVLGSLEPIPGPATERIGAKAREHEMLVAFGMLARGENGGRPTNASVLFDPTGSIVNVHRKAHLTPVYEAPDFDAGNEFNVTDTSIGTLGNMVCADFTLPETSRILAIKGARILCGSVAAFYLPEPEPRDNIRHLYLNTHTSPTRALDNAVFMVMANMCGWNAGLEFFGMSRIIAPNGRIVAEGGEGAGSEELVIADIDPDDRDGGMPFRLIDRRRPDLYEALLTPNPDAGSVDWKR